MNHIGNENHEIEIIIARYFGGNISPEETDVLCKWIELSPENRKFFLEQQDVWEALNPSFEVSDNDLEKSLKKILVKTGIEPAVIGVLKKFIAFWSKIAAVAVLPLLAITIYFLVKSGNEQIQNITLSTDYGCTSKATLPDGTVVWLNAKSTLVYPDNMSDKCRDVNLRGEAYFNVYADKEHPFVVHTPGISVTAVGTEFNVNAYSPNVAVTLAEGKVEIDNSGNKLLMHPGEHYAIRNGHGTVDKDINLDKYCSWRNGILIFDDEPIFSLCERLEQIYNVRFEIDPKLKDRTFRFILKGENLSEIMNLFQLTAPVECTFENNIHTVDTVASPQTIRIKLL